jgi:DNA polymerase-1
MAFPTWYITPSYEKEGAGGLGGTLQGRITAKGPSRQTFPPLVKKSLRSRWSGGLVVSFDLSQIELRVAALLSGDEGMVQAYREGKKLHDERAVQIFGAGCENHPDFQKHHRQVGKTINFADLFLAGAPKIQQTLMEMTGELFDLQFCQDIVDARRRDRPGLCSWHDSLFETVERQGYLELPFTGQSRFFYLPEDKKEVVNFPVQTTAGNTLLYIQHHFHHTCLPRLNAQHPWCYMTAQVYDSIDFDLKNRELLPLLEGMFIGTLHRLTSGGYWGQLQDHYGREVPLDYSVEVHQ